MKVDRWYVQYRAWPRGAGAGRDITADLHGGETCRTWSRSARRHGSGHAWMMNDVQSTDKRTRLSARTQTATQVCTRACNKVLNLEACVIACMRCIVSAGCSLGVRR